MYEVPLSGGSPVQPAMQQSNVWGIAVDATRLYWTANFGVQSVTLTPAQPVSLYSGAMGQNQPLDLALDAASVYWTDAQAGTVMKVAKP